MLHEGRARLRGVQRRQDGIGLSCRLSCRLLYLRHWVEAPLAATLFLLVYVYCRCLDIVFTYALLQRV